jgi:hypothetical protein
MPSSSVESLLHALTSFLDVAITGVLPERDAPAAESIGRRICAQWPADDAEWDAARAEIAQGVAAHFAERPSLWPTVLHLLALYVDHISLDEINPRHEGAARVHARGKPVYPVELGIARAVAAELLGSFGDQRREQFFESLNEWDAWEATARALQARRPRLDAKEALVLATHALRVTRGIGNADSLLDPIQSGLLGSGQAIDVILDGWLEETAPYADAEPQVIGLLARWRLPHRADAGDVRRRLVRRLARLPLSQGGYESHLVAFGSWPPDTSLAMRRDALLEALKRTGPTGGVAALRALAFYVDDHPLEALPILDNVVARSDPSDPHLPFARLRVLRRIGQGLSRIEGSSSEIVAHAKSLFERLPRPSDVPPDPLWELDRTLAPLVAHVPGAVREYVLWWLEEHRARLVAKGDSLSDALPSTRRLMPGFGWLVEAAVSASPARRRVAVSCLVDADSDNRPEHAPITTETCGSLTRAQVEGLARMLLYQAGLGEATVELLFALARVRRDCLDVLGPLLALPAMRAYPGRHARCVDAWAEAVAGRATTDAEVEVVEKLRQAIAERQQGFDVREQLWPVLFDRTRPTARAMHDLVRRQQRIAEEKERQRSPFRALATVIPIACGEAFDHTGRADRASPLQPTSWELEGLALDAYDPLAAGFARLEHAREASRLLGDEGERGDSEP